MLCFWNHQFLTLSIKRYTLRYKVLKSWNGQTFLAPVSIHTFLDLTGGSKPQSPSKIGTLSPLSAWKVSFPHSTPTKIVCFTIPQDLTVWRSAISGCLDPSTYLWEIFPRNTPLYMITPWTVDLPTGPNLAVAARIGALGSLHSACNFFSPKLLLLNVSFVHPK